MNVTSPRIWRSPNSPFYQQECRDAPSIYTDEELAGIASHGFNGVWLRGRLSEMVRSDILPQLNQPESQKQLESLRTLIGRATKHGIGVWLFFNEPLAPLSDAPIWQEHPELKGEPHPPLMPGQKRNFTTLCTSHPTVQAYLRDAMAQIMRGLGGLGGVLLITASEHYSHCWSHHSLIQHQYLDKVIAPMTCPRCRQRKPEDVVGELVGFWHEAAQAVKGTPKPRVVAWNWSWSMWYPEPQKPVIDALPQGVSLMADWERGDHRPFQGKTIPIDEYSLSFTGPSERFKGSQAAANEKGRAMFAKLQFGTTHELATVPNLPLISSVHGKLTGLYQRGVEGFMGCWNFGCGRTLNTYANKIVADDPGRAADQQNFYTDLTQKYLGLPDPAPLAAAWEAFTRIFRQYPFSIGLTYYSFFNYAPAYPLSLEYHGRRMGPSWMAHEPWGDDIETGLQPFSAEEVLHAFEPMSGQWAAALGGYVAALAQGGGSPDQKKRRWEESSCARMIGLHLRSAANIMRFHLWRKPRLAGRTGPYPWTIEPDDALKPIVADEIQSVRQAISLAQADPRLGFHQECQAYFYTPEHLRRKLEGLERLLAAV
jgi:hypothetical protein